MTFALPQLLWLLLGPVLAVALELVRRRRTRQAAQSRLLHGVAGAHSFTLAAAGAPAPVRAPRVHGRLWLALACGLVALARPQWGEIEQQVFDQSREIVIAVDLSRSMLADDVKPSRLDRAKLLIQALLERLRGERVGLLVFAGTAFLQSPLSADYEVLNEFLPELGPDFLPEGGSNYSAMLDAALDAFTGTAGADRFLVVLSDGESTADDWRERLDPLREKGIRVLGLGLGTPAGAMIADGAGGFVKDERGAVVLSRLQPATLQELAQATQGRYVDASTWVDLAALVQETVEAGRAGEFQETSSVRRVERFQWPLAAGFVFLLWSLWREVPVQPRSRRIWDVGTPSPAGGAGVATLVLLALGLAAAPRPARAQTPPEEPSAIQQLDPATGAAKSAPASDVLAEPLGKLTAELATADRPPAAADWRRFAEITIDYAHRKRQSQEPVPPRTITDGLDAVDRGESLDPKAADWPQLRELLQEFQKQQEHPPDQQQQPQQDQQQQQDGQSEDQKNNQGQSQDGKGESEQPEGGDEQQQQQQRDQSQPGDSESGKPDDTARTPEEQRDAQSAFGDMQEQPDQPEPLSSVNEPPPEDPAGGENPEDTQQIGGQPQDQAADPARDHPGLAIPLQRLDRLREQDSPARLFQLMEPKTGQPAPPKKDW